MTNISILPEVINEITCIEKSNAKKVVIDLLRLLRNDPEQGEVLNTSKDPSKETQDSIRRIRVGGDYWAIYFLIKDTSVVTAIVGDHKMDGSSGRREPTLRISEYRQGTNEELQRIKVLLNN